MTSDGILITAAKLVLRKRQQNDSTITGNERGVALILALVLLALLTMLGAWALDTSSTDLKIAGNYANSQAGFSLADTGVAYASSNTILQNACLNLATCSSTTVTNTSYPVGPIIISGNTVTASIEFMGKGLLPAGSVYDADVAIAPDGTLKPKFSGLYFSVSATGSGPNNAKSAIEKNVVQVVSNF